MTATPQELSTRGPVPRLHVLTDEVVQDRFSHAELAAQAVEGGADAVQFREKRPRTTRALIETARALREAVPSGRARLFVNDRVDVAVACGADGVHLGQQDPEPELARDLLPESAHVGGTANSFAEAMEVARGPVDYLGVGPVYGTQTKQNPAPPMPLSVFARIAREVGKPVIAIGGITVERVPELIALGAWGVAVVRAVVAAPDPREATQRFREAIDAALLRPYAGAEAG